MIFEQYQHAFYVHDDRQAEAAKQALGLEDAEWIEDEVTGQVWIGESIMGSTSVARLRFCYSFPVEIELLTYLSGPHWHMQKLKYRRGEPFVSHIGFHMEGDYATNRPPPSKGGRRPLIAQRMETLSHTNPYLREKKRRYRYEIHSQKMSPFARALGVDLKYIWRIEG